VIVADDGEIIGVIVLIGEQDHLLIDNVAGGTVAPRRRRGTRAAGTC
jgi:hypothetical protein